MSTPLPVFGSPGHHLTLLAVALVSLVLTQPLWMDCRHPSPPREHKENVDMDFTYFNIGSQRPFTKCACVCVCVCVRVCVCVLEIETFQLIMASNIGMAEKQ